MKKIAKCMCMMAVVALAFTSCKKTETTQVLAFNNTTEQLVNDEGSFEKVYLDQNYKVHFENGDEVMVFNIQNETGAGSAGVKYTVTGDGNQLTPAGGSIDQNGNFYAFYPGGNVNLTETQLYNQNRAVFTLQPTQVCRIIDGKPAIPVNSLYMAAKDAIHTSWSETYFDFKNICGVLSCKFYSPSGKVVKSIAVTDRKFHLTGDVTMKIHEVDPGEMSTLFRNYSDSDAYWQQLLNYENRVGYSVTNTGSTVTLDCSQVGGVQLGQTKEEATRFFIVLRPLALLYGCDILITFDDDDTYEIHSTRDNRISPNVIRNISAVNVD